jgi:hypothetical protein
MNSGVEVQLPSVVISTINMADIILAAYLLGKDIPLFTE